MLLKHDKYNIIAFQFIKSTYITKIMVKISYIFCLHILLYSNTCQII